MMESPMLSGSCRCCASEGAYKDVKSSYHWMGEEEIYADMLKDCFDISLSPASDGQDEGGICEICITQLRNAANFKKQVLHTDEQFKNKLQSGYFKPEIVKVELPGEDGIESDDNNASVEEGYSGPEFEVPIKAEEIEESKPKKRAAKKGPTTRAKKAKTGAEDAETSTKRVQRQPKATVINILKRLNEINVTVKRSGSMREGSPYQNVSSVKVTEQVWKHRHNIRRILLYSNATPIRRYEDAGFLCCFCNAQYTDPATLKSHTIEEHTEATKAKFMQNVGMSSFLVKLDITHLECNICFYSVDSLQELIDHLNCDHGKSIFTDINNHILPLKFEDGVLFKCVLCNNNLNTFKSLQEHMSSHYRNYICNICGAGFVTRQMIRGHNETHMTGTFKCTFCPNIYDTPRKKKSHESSVHVKMLHKCGHCNEKFNSYDRKLKHFANEHGIPMPKIGCQACGKTFRKQSLLTSHIHKDHLMEKRHMCTECDMGFFSMNRLKDHMQKHFGLKNYNCEICLKSFVRKKSLREHIRIHMNDKRFKCELCGHAFVQKCAWAGHMRSKHGNKLL